MKTYNIFYVLLALIIFSCSEADQGSGEGLGGGETTSIDADYAVLLEKAGNITTQLLNANREVMTLNPSESALVKTASPLLVEVLGSKFLQYQKNADCTATITMHDFSTDTNEEIEVFSDFNDCSLQAMAITLSEQSLFIAYQLDLDGKNKENKVRVIDLGTSEPSFVDIEIAEKPIDLVIANNRLFVMTLDEEITDENNLTVIDLATTTLIHKMSLGNDVRRIFKNRVGNIIISYDELHTTLNSDSMAFVYTNYENGKEPNFTSVQADFFDNNGRMYYRMNPATYSEYDASPAIYDFSKNLTIIYSFENFLTGAQRNLEFEIENTTVVGYDSENDLILIGYKKSSGNDKGGLLRITPNPLPDKPAFIDNINLDGVPTQIIVNYN